MTAAPGEADPTPGVRQLFGAVKQEFVRRTMIAGIWITFFKVSQQQSCEQGDRLTTMTTGFGWRETGKFP